MKKQQHGFTLLELMVTIAIVGIVALIAIWNSSDMLENNRAENYLLELKRNISFARAKATSTDSLIVVCSGETSRIENDQKVTCLDDWSEGSIVVFHDSNSNGVHNPRRGDIILRVMAEIPETSKLKFTGDSSLIFDASGRITTNPGTFVYCPNKDNENNKEMEVSVSGTALYFGDTTNTCD
ncbi:MULTISPECIES: GspH/FimT family pseudopilin [Pseudoalteromonas]|uniref:Type II secretion system protein H n=1 Tax=Pseudoalteromonas haloplanktis TaxID=228 RepID=A0ABU1B9R9_PSEHA|nr:MULTISPECIES: GspH/FimT family pseudopilin [Pseudoalteromonas]MCF6143601.1 type IV fimbrial biogenesis protein FimT [Pseudoalteromonas mariniglutinosa NCIMB 1770]MDQ9091221.1 GspH/FimT family pseudopilin [Pseudoalteromonas haloplanktis]TMN71351.1 prepilin-type N-terminal cleavage/methylation domain-containing protein [Pseudoalteromonas sp. S1727]BDF93628.1 type IV pilus biogenesis protein FimU [Pseudoalteromonas sp. KAN5]